MTAASDLDPKGLKLDSKIDGSKKLWNIDYSFVYFELVSELDVA